MIIIRFKADFVTVLIEIISKDDLYHMRILKTGLTFLSELKM